MASPSDSISMAVFCDFENVALGVRDAQYEKFDIKPVLERLLLKGSIVVKKAYCDWERYKGFKATMHEANFELIEIPHVRQSGKNSADIRLVVDALDLCYTKSHVNTFVIISGDSDFSPLVSKLRENAKQVIGVGVKQSTSDLLIANCDEFIFYDDLVREKQRALARRQNTGAAPAPRRTPEEERQRKETQDARRGQGVELAVETFEALTSERGDSGKIWASVLKEAIKRRKPDFSESYYGFRTFGNLLEEAQARGLLEFGRDEKSGAYVFRSLGSATGAVPEAPARAGADAQAERQGGAGYFRHDFHPVASVPEPAPAAGQGDGGGQVASHLAGEAGPGQHRDRRARQALGGDVGHQLQRTLLDALGTEHDGQAVALPRRHATGQVEIGARGVARQDGLRHARAHAALADQYDLARTGGEAGIQQRGAAGAQFAQRDVEGTLHMTACELALFAHVDQGGAPVETRDRFLRRSLLPAAAEQGLEHAQHHDLPARCRGAGAAAGAQ